MNNEYNKSIVTKLFFSIEEYNKIRKITDKEIIILNNSKSFNKNQSSQKISFSKYIKTKDNTLKLLEVLLLFKGNDDYFYVRDIFNIKVYKIDQFSDLKVFIRNVINNYKINFEIY